MIELKATKEEIVSKIQQYKDCDPEVLGKLKKEIQVSRQGANRWTDNIYSLHSWINKKFPSIAIGDLNKQFGIPEDLDYL